MSVPHLLAPPLAFLAYLALVGLLLGLGRVLVGTHRRSAALPTVYASGEAPGGGHALPGYRLYSGVALFFAVLHVGVLVASTGALTPVGVLYVAGLLVVLLVVALG